MPLLILVAKNKFLQNFLQNNKVIKYFVVNSFLQLALLLFYIFPVCAAEIDNVVNEQNRVIQNQQQFEQDKQYKSELQNMDIERKSQAMEDVLAADVVNDKILNKRCFEASKITFIKNQIITKEEEKGLTLDFIGKCMSLQDIEKLLKKISDYLSEKEYVTSKAALLKKDFATKELIIEIIEGRLEDLLFNQDSLFDKMQKFAAFGAIKKHEPLNLHDINIGLDQINRLPSNKASIKILSSLDPNSSIIALQNQPKNTLRAKFVFDDLGSQSMGKNRDTLSFTYDNLLHLNDSVSFSRTSNDLIRNKKFGKNETLNFSLSLPFKGNLLTLTHINYSHSLLRQGNENIDIRSYGKSLTSSAMLESVLIKYKKYRLKSQLSLTTKDINNFIDDVRIDSSSRKATIVAAAFPNKFFFEKGNLLLKPSYLKGIKSLGASKDSKDIASQSSHSQFDMLKFYANYSRGFEIPVLKVPFSYVGSFDGQISKQKLYSNDRFFIGGAYTVRGFENGLIGGDAGYLIKNEASFNVGKIFASLVSSHNSSALAGLYNFSITPFYDYGYIKERGTNRAGRLAGGGFRTSFSHKSLTANLTMAWVADKSRLLQDYYHENQAIYFDITTSFGFF